MRVRRSRLLFQSESEVGLSRPRSSKVCVEKIVLCPFQCKPRPSGVSLESPGLGAEVDQNHDARNAVSATLSVLSEVVLYFGTETPKCALKKLCCVHFNANQGHQEVVCIEMDTAKLFEAHF